jgi:HEPN domain-containing protein
MKTEEYKDWISKSEDNLKWASDNLKDENYVLVCFLSQQAVEIILKGYCYYKNKIPPRIHDLLQLDTDCEALGLKIEKELIPKISRLSEYYMKSRYPDMVDRQLERKDVAAEALEFAKEIVEVIKSQLTSTG